MTLADLAPTSFTVSDWIGFAGLICAQTLAVGTLIWKLASRLQSIEAKVDLLVKTEIANLKERLTTEIANIKEQLLHVRRGG